MASEQDVLDKEFYCRYYVGHRGKFGHEFMEFEFHSDGTLRYANNSRYKRDKMIRKKCKVTPALLEEARRIVRESEILGLEDEAWPEPNDIGKQELEVVDGDEHIAFSCAKIGSLADIHRSKDPEGLQTFYFLIQDLKCLVFSLISMHFKIKPIP